MATILVIDDIEYVRERVSHFLQKEGHTVYTAENGLKGCEIIRDKKIDLLITDVVMPGKGGVDVLLEMKSELKDKKIIVITGKVSPDSDAFKILIEQLGAHRVLFKPFKKGDLLDAVNGILEEIG
ncbi:MAG: response regulator [Spirochaetales bacterium]|nr:response regulator [Spirochaetales bacterium]